MGPFAYYKVRSRMTTVVLQLRTGVIHVFVMKTCSTFTAKRKCFSRYGKIMGEMITFLHLIISIVPCESNVTEVVKACSMYIAER